MLERLFHLEAHGTTARREALGGLTTFAMMAYIVVVNAPSSPSPGSRSARG